MDVRRITRRHWLAAAGSSAAALVSACASARHETSRPHDAAGAVAAHVDRLTWGANDATVTRVRRQGFEPWLAGQLRGRADAPLPGDVQARIAQMSISRESLESLVLRMDDRRKAADTTVDDEAKKAAQRDYQQELTRLSREAASRHLLRALYSPEQVLERMTWFWLNHFNVFQYMPNVRAMLADYEETIRARALGRFRDLLGAVALHPAMLRYLDNEQNAANRINENYARELMELHTLGVDAGYSQRDVQELARVLTGVGVNLTPGVPPVRRELQSFYVRRGVFEFNPNRHDFGPKQLLGQPIAGRGLSEMDTALDMLARHPAAARFICRKLAMFWMSDDPPPEVVDAMAATFRQTDGHIARVLATLFDMPAFWQARKFKDPMNYVVSAVRAAYDERIILNTGPMLNWLARLGEPLYGRQTPDGYPLDARAWSSAGQMATRFEIGKAIGTGSAGLFRADEPGAENQPAFPQLTTPLHYEWRAGTLSAETRTALAQAVSPQEWNTFLLASPEFMQR